MTATQKHTPGPWKWHLSHAKDFATIGGKGGEHVATCDSAISGFRDKNEANARLIAAAPELLEACKAITRELEYAYGGHGQMPTMEAKFYEQAKSAIAKAEGKE